MLRVSLKNTLLILAALPFLSGYTLLAYELDGKTSASSVTQAYDEAKLARVASHFGDSPAPEKKAYEQMIAEALSRKQSILPLRNLTTEKEKIAQEVVLANDKLKAFAIEPSSKKNLRAEVMSVTPAMPGDVLGTNGACAQENCYRVNVYNFYFNVTTSALVDVVGKKVVAMNSIRESQPELSDRLQSLAVSIAKAEPAVQYEVGRYLEFIGDKTLPSKVAPVMASTKSALKDTLCERSKHLCVSPTYVLGDKALWVIVDLTDMKVVGLRWTSVGDSGPPTLVTERLLENDYVFKNFCKQINQIERDGWSFDYHITTSDGLRLANAKFNQSPVFASAKVVDWHVSYSRKDKYGYSDATGCPMFSSAVVVAFDGPKIQPIVESGKEVGFYISQTFQQQSWPAPCNYRYEERYEFYRDGRYRVAMKSHGRGCGDYGTYRPVFRMDLGKTRGGDNYALERWADSWKPIASESWSKQRAPQRLAKQKYSHRIVDPKGGGYTLEPSAGQFGDGGRGDNAYVYVTVMHPDKDEGNQDLVTLGSCCNTGHAQGPELFMQPAEALKDQQLVLWYVPQLENDGTKGEEYCWAENEVVNGVLKTKTWPCTAGPMFVPISE